MGSTERPLLQVLARYESSQPSGLAYVINIHGYLLNIPLRCKNMLNIPSVQTWCSIPT
jgi:hypothetical protein